MLHKETIIFSWQTLEFEPKKKRKDWYWIVGIIAIILIIIGIILGNYLFSFLIGIGSFLMIYMSNNEPLVLDVEISRRGIQVHKDFYSFDIISAFWITEDRKGQPLLLIFVENKQNSPIISISINDSVIQLMELRDFLLEFIEEQEMTESLTSRIIDRIGF